MPRLSTFQALALVQTALVQDFQHVPSEPNTTIKCILYRETSCSALLQWLFRATSGPTPMEALDRTLHGTVWVELNGNGMRLGWGRGWGGNFSESSYFFERNVDRVIGS